MRTARLFEGTEVFFSCSVFFSGLYGRNMKKPSEKEDHTDFRSVRAIDRKKSDPCRRETAFHGEGQKESISV